MRFPLLFVAVGCALAAVRSEMPDYTTAVNAQAGNAVVLLVQEGCAPCRQLENDLIPILRQGGMMTDSAIIILSVEERPQAVRQLQGGRMNQSRGFPVILVYREKGGQQWGWRHAGYPGSTVLIQWLRGIDRWRPPKKGVSDGIR